MSMPSNIGAYGHVRIVIDKALAGGLPATYTLRTKQEAVRWRLEAHYFRKLANQLGQHSYDNIKFRIQLNKIIMEWNVPTGELTVAGGATVAIVAEQAGLEEALALKDELGLEDDQ